MARVVCQLVNRGHQIAVLWSDGAASFEPYYLDGGAFTGAWHAREQLAQASASGNAEAAVELATHGHELYRQLFQLEEPTPAAQVVHSWWQHLQNKGAVQSLEIVSDTPDLAPWNLLYDRPPDAAALRAGPSSPAWQHFWGFRFALGVGRSVHPQRVFPHLGQPTLLVALDPMIENFLSNDRRKQIEQIVGQFGATVVRSFDEFAQHVHQQAPDVLAVVSRFEDDHFLLGDTQATAADLSGMLGAAKDGSLHPLVVLLRCRGANDPAHWEDFSATLLGGFSSLLTAGVPCDAGINLRLGISWLTKFLSGEADAAESLRQARLEIGLEGLAFDAYCPPYLRVLLDGQQPDPTLPTPKLCDAPAQPYRPLAPFDREDRALFSGRDEETLRLARLLDHADTRGILLHGPSGVGKASLVRAGLLPFLEDEALGYLTLRDRSDAEQIQSERDHPTLALRASNDLAGQLAEALVAFCAQPFAYATPAGTTVTVDLPEILRRHLTGAPATSSDAIQEKTDKAAATSIAPGAPAGDNRSDPVDLWQALQDDPSTLGRLLEELTRQLPFELLIVIEQGEDMVTQVHSALEKERRDAALAMLGDLARSTARCKVIMILRTEFFGRLSALLPMGPERAAWREFYLRPLTKEALTEALLLPTATEPPLYAQAAPHERYRFAFGAGVIDQIVADAVALAPEQNVSAVAIAQAACACLVENLGRRKETLVKLEHLRELCSAKRGRIDLAQDRLIDNKLARLPIGRAAQQSVRGLMGKLFRRHPEGGLVRPLTPARDLAKHWQGGDTVENAVNAAAGPDVHLLEVQQLLIAGQEGLYVSLAHDALAAWGERQTGEQQRHQQARSKVVDALFIMLPLAVLAVAVTYYILRAGQREVESELEAYKTEIKPQVTQLMLENQAAAVPLYSGALAQAERALQAGNMLRARQLLLSQQPAANPAEERIDRRGFAWHYLWKQANPERQTLQGHQGLVNAVATSPDSALVATAGADGTVRLWNLKRDGEVASILTGHQGPVLAVAFAPDGKTVASAGADTVIHVWDVKLGDEDPTSIDQAGKLLAGHQGPILALAYGKDANTLISGSADKTAIVWDIAAGKPKATLKDHGDAVTSVAVAPGGEFVATGAADKNVIVWAADGAKKINTLKVPGAVVALAFAAEGAVLASASQEAQAGADLGTVRIWDAQSGKEVAAPITHGAALFGIAFKPKSTVIVTAGKDHTVRAWDYTTGREQFALRGHLGWVRGVAVTPDGKTLATTGHDNTVRVWNASPPTDILSHGDWVQALAFSSDDQWLASGGRDGVVKVWRATTGDLLGEIKGHPGPITALAFVPDAKDRKLVVGSWSENGEGSVKLLELALALGKFHVKEGPAFQGHTKGVASIAMGKNKTLATGSADGTVILWDVATGKSKHTLNAEHPVRTVALSPSGARLASGDERGQVRLWDTISGKLHTRESIKEVAAHAGGIHAFAFLGEDFEFISAGADNTVKQWNWKPDKKPAAELVSRAHNQPASGITLLGGPAFATCSWDGTIRLWDRRDAGFGEDRFTLLGHTGPVRALAVTSNRQLMASGGHDGTIRLWRASPPLAAPR